MFVAARFEENVIVDSWIFVLREGRGQIGLAHQKLIHAARGAALPYPARSADHTDH